jgi:hypothetical protein
VALDRHRMFEVETLNNGRLIITEYHLFDDYAAVGLRSCRNSCTSSTLGSRVVTNGPLGPRL